MTMSWDSGKEFEYNVVKSERSTLHNFNTSPKTNDRAKKSSGSRTCDEVTAK